MSRIAAEELPSPVAAPAPQVVWAPLATAPAAAPARRSGTALIGGLAVVAAGVFGFLQLRNDDSNTASNPTVVTNATNAVDGNGVAGNSALTEQQLSGAYTAIFGTTADSSTMGCLSQQIGTAGGEAARLAQGETLGYEQAKVGFVPFAACASDADFVGQLLAATVSLYPNGADQECVAIGLASFDVADRADALALALTRKSELGNRLYNYFIECAF